MQFTHSHAIILVIIFWNFTVFQYRSVSPEVKRNLIPSIAIFLYELPHDWPIDLRLRILRNQEILENLKFEWTYSLVPSFHSRLRLYEQQLKNMQKYILNYACPVLLDYSILFQIFFSGLSESANFWAQHDPVSFQLLFFDIFYKSRAFL